jgi:hypothetical protein
MNNEILEVVLKTIMGLLVTIFIMVVIAIYVQPPDPRIAKCEAKDGVWIAHTYSVGKYQNSESIGCFSKSALIGIDNE